MVQIIHVSSPDVDEGEDDHRSNDCNDLFMRLGGKEKIL
jgi:hypothetical protein